LNVRRCAVGKNCRQMPSAASLATRPTCCT
jgi:hypothetical protein